MTAALEGGEWSAARPGRTLPPGKTRYPSYRKLGGLQGRSGRTENLVNTGIRSRTVQPVFSRYTDCATRPTTEMKRSGTHCTGGWVGPRVFLDGRKISSPPGFDLGPFSPYSVAIPTELPGPHRNIYL